MIAIDGHATKAVVEAPSGDVGPDRSGWPTDASERRDFLHRIRAFPPEVADWRKALVRRIVEGDERFPAAPESRTVSGVRSLLDEGISQLREIARILDVLYETPRLGNPEDPLDELIFIILSRKTREEAYQGAYQALG